MNPYIFYDYDNTHRSMVRVYGIDIVPEGTRQLVKKKLKEYQEE